MAEAEKDNMVLRFVGSIDVVNKKCSVKLDKYPKTHPFAGTQYADNIVAFDTGIQIFIYIYIPFEGTQYDENIIAFGTQYADNIVAFGTGIYTFMYIHIYIYIYVPSRVPSTTRMLSPLILVYVYMYMYTHAYLCTYQFSTYTLGISLDWIYIYI